MSTYAPNPDDGFIWSCNADTDEGSVFTLLPERMEVLVVNDKHVACSRCVSKTHDLECHDLPNCDTVAFVPNTRESIVRIVEANLNGEQWE
jgi:hypothetical protein